LDRREERERGGRTCDLLDERFYAPSRVGWAELFVAGPVVVHGNLPRVRRAHDLVILALRNCDPPPNQSCTNAQPKDELTLPLALEPRREPRLAAEHDLAHALPSRIPLGSLVCGGGGGRAGEREAGVAQRAVEGERLVDRVREERGSREERRDRLPELAREEREEERSELALEKQTGLAPSWYRYAGTGRSRERTQATIPR
jgi:hypothetical protein